jgi:hypothetical protein
MNVTATRLPAPRATVITPLAKRECGAVAMVPAHVAKYRPRCRSDLPLCGRGSGGALAIYHRQSVEVRASRTS